MAGKGKAINARAKKMGQLWSHKADLQFPINHIARFLKVSKYADRVSSRALVYLAAVSKYLAIKNVARDNKKLKIIPRHIQLAVKNDKELSRLLRTMTIASSGVFPNIYNMLLPKKTITKGPTNDD